MTHILALTNRRTAYQVSDRLVTKRALNASPKVHSPLENKAIIFICKDAVGTIGYTGIAYVNRQPTDQWLANVLAPQPIGTPGLGQFGFGGRGMGAIRLQTLIWRLRNEIKSMVLPQGARFFELVISGFRIRRHRSIPFQLQITRNQLGTRISGFMRRPANRDQRVLISEIGDGFQSKEVIDAIEEGAAACKERGEDDPLLGGLIHAVRLRSGQTRAAGAQTVGSNLMAITVPNPVFSREIIWRFVPDSIHTAQIEGPEQSRTVTVIYSPWVITASLVTCPMVGTSALDIHTSGFTIRACLPPTPPQQIVRRGKGRILFAATNQTRSAPP